MKISSRPQTSLRIVSKKLRLLYPIEDTLNDYIDRYTENYTAINPLQIFFDTDIVDEDYVKLLDLRRNSSSRYFIKLGYFFTFEL